MYPDGICHSSRLQKHVSAQQLPQRWTPRARTFTAAPTALNRWPSSTTSAHLCRAARSKQSLDRLAHFAPTARSACLPLWVHVQKARPRLLFEYPYNKQTCRMDLSGLGLGLRSKCCQPDPGIHCRESKLAVTLKVAPLPENKQEPPVEV
eukprot:1156772-Pelagomonas_calceolata.AAC.9